MQEERTLNTAGREIDGPSGEAGSGNRRQDLDAKSLARRRSASGRQEQRPDAQEDETRDS